MSKKLDHQAAGAKARGRRDHDYRGKAEARRREIKEDAARVAKRVAAGRPNTSKTARLSGPVIHVDSDAAASIAAEHGMKISQDYGHPNNAKTPWPKV